MTLEMSSESRTGRMLSFCGTQPHKKVELQHCGDMYTAKHQLEAVATP